MSIRRPKTDTIRRLQRDDIARRAVLQFQRDPTFLEDTGRNPVVREMYELATRLRQEQKSPRQVAGWIALVLYFGEEEWLRQMRASAHADANPIYTRAQSWLELIDRARENRE